MGKGPLSGYRVLELAGVGPAEYCALLLSDLGAEVVRVDRATTSERNGSRAADVVARGRRSIVVDLKHASALPLFFDLVQCADVILDPYRPGVAERLGIGPDACRDSNGRLVYARITGWGQEGPLARHAGHDLNYISVAGALAHIGRTESPPVPPLNLVGDMAAGGLMTAFGVVAALLEREQSGRGQVIDGSIVDGTASLMSMVFGFHANGYMTQDRGTNVFDSGAPFYDVYECADGKYISVAAIERKFYDELVTALGLDEEALPPRSSKADWPELRDRFAEVFATKSRDEWAQVLQGYTEVCFAPVMTMLEAAGHPHMASRETYVELDGVLQPAPAPRFSRTPGAIQGPAPMAGGHTGEVLRDWLDLSEARISDLRASGVVIGPTEDET